MSIDTEQAEQYDKTTYDGTSVFSGFLRKLATGEPLFAGFYQKIGESLSVFQKFNEWLHSVDWQPIIDSISGLLAASEHALVAKTLEENQWIFLEIPLDTCKKILEKPEDCDNIMRDFYISNDYCNIKNLFECYKEHQHMKRQTLNFSDTFDCFLSGKHYGMIILSLTAILDGLLYDIVIDSKDRKANWKKRTSWEKRLMHFEPLGSMTLEEIAEKYPQPNALHLLMLLWTLGAIETFSASHDFDKCELPTMNRNWIMHGRSSREFTDIDCIKLFIFIFSLLKLDDFMQSDEVIP